MNVHTPKKKKTFKQKLQKGCKGAISILLCLLMTPFISIALGLVEYSRYQSMMELTEELYELTGISLMSDYDSYLHDRFGLLATNQSGSLGDSADSYMQTNKLILGKQIEVGGVGAKGKLALSNEDILRQQVIDVSELTATTAVIADDFKLQDLLNKLKGVSQFTSLMNTMDGMADLCDALDDAVDALENLEAVLKKLQTAVNNAKSSATTLATNLSNFYKKMYEKGASLASGANQNAIDAAMALITQEDLDELIGLYKDTKNLMGNLESIKTNLGSVKRYVGEFKDAVKAAADAAEKLTTSNSVDENGKISEVAKESLTGVLEEMQKLVDETLADLKDTTIDTAKETVDAIIDQVVATTGLAGYTTRYSEIVYGEYFKLPLSATAKQDLVDLLKAIKSCVDSKGLDGMTQFFKDKFVPSLNFNVTEITKAVSNTLKEALKKLGDKATEKVGTLLTKLVNIVKGLFDLDVFWEEDMNAFVNISTNNPSGYQKFLTAVGNLFSAISDFKDAIKEVSLRKFIKAMKEMFESIWDMLDAIKTIAADMISSIGELLSSAVKGDVKNLYEKLLISGYMRHNLPCRLDSGDYSYDPGSNSVNLDLSGKGLTGYSYNDIVRPASYGGQSAAPIIPFVGGSKFQQLNSTLNALKKGAGTDTMFRGAELEYIRAGTNSEIANQIIVFFDIYFLRLLLDLPSIFLDGEVASVAAAATIAAWVVYILYIIVEPFCDTILLVNGAEVPLIRTDCWLTATGVGTLITKLADITMSDALKNSLKEYGSTYGGGNAEIPKSSMTTGGSGLGNVNYRTHMLILLLIYVESDDQISRFQDLVELEAKAYYTKNGGSFSMSKAYTAVEVTGEVTFNPFFDLGTYSGGSPLDMTKTLKRTVTY